GRRGAEGESRLDALLRQGSPQGGLVREFADDQPAGRGGRAMTGREVVVNPDLVPRRGERPRGVTADVARTARYQDAHAHLVVPFVPVARQPYATPGPGGGTVGAGLGAPR